MEEEIKNVFVPDWNPTFWTNQITKSNNHEK